MLADLYTTYLNSDGVETDTRKPLHNKVFFALNGENFDGNKFAHKAIEQGAILAVIDNRSFEGDKTLLVDDVLTTLQQLGLYHRQQLGIPVIAITGSNGKTTTKELMHAVLIKKYRTSATKGNLNNHIGIPLTLLNIPSDAEIAIVEMGANHQEEIKSYCTYTEPDFGIITNIGKAHIEGFGSLEGIRKGKGELYDYLRAKDKTVFVNSDDEVLMQMSEGIKKHTYGSDPHSDTTGNVMASDDNLLHVKVENQEIATQLTGNYNVPNVLASICVGQYFEVSMDDCADAISNYLPDNSRSQIVKKQNRTIVLDAYNANPTSMKLALENFASMAHSPKVAFIGGMKELGSASQEEHQNIIDLARSLDIDEIVLVGTEFNACEYNDLYYFSDSSEAGEFASNLPDDLEYFVLVKGSRSTQMEEILKFL